MAAPTIHYRSATAGTGSSALSVWAPKLDDMLVNDAGWDRSFIDSDAIGGGSAGAPAWDKTPATNTDAGVAVYRMPANDHDTRWYARLRLGWATNVVRPHIRGVTIGTTHNGTGGVTGAGGELVPSAGAGVAGNGAHQISVSEDGFGIRLDASNPQHVPVTLIERARRIDTGAITDDLLVYNAYGTGGTSRLARAGVGVVHDDLPIILGGYDGNTVPTVFAGSIANYDASGIPIAGLFWTRGFPYYHGRLAFLVSARDHTSDSAITHEIDGQGRAYRTAATANASTWVLWAFATE